MKKLILAITLTGLIGSLPPQKAHGGIILMRIGAAVDKGDGWDGMLWGWGGFATAWVGFFVGLFNPEVGFGLIVLDENSTYRGNDLASIFHQRYPSIEDHSVLFDLAAAMEKRASQIVGETLDGPVYVTLEREDILDLLAPADLDSSVIEQVVRDLGPSHSPGEHIE